MSNELTPIQPQPQQQITLQDQMAFAKAVCQSDIIPTVYRGKPANILVAVGYGAPLGLTPMQSLQDISVINGKPTASASFIASHVRMAGHKLRVKKDEKALSVTATIVRSDDPDYPISVTRDKAWAQQMGLLNKDNYRKQPLTMLTWRAITAVAREACPEILYNTRPTSSMTLIPTVTCCRKSLTMNSSRHARNVAGMEAARARIQSSRPSSSRSLARPNRRKPSSPCCVIAASRRTRKPSKCCTG